MRCEDVREILEEVALGSRERDPEVERHLAGCSECRALLADCQQALSELPAAVALVSPHHAPKGAEARLRAALAEAGAPAVESEAAGPHVGTGPSPDERPPSVEAPARRRGLLLRVAVLVALVLAVGSLGWAFRLNSALARERSLRNDLAAQLGQQEVVLDVVDSPRTQKTQLRAAQPGSTAYGKLYTRPDLPSVVVMAGRLPAPPAGQVFAVWLTIAGDTRLAGLLTTNDQGFGLLVFAAGRPGPVYDAAYVVVQAPGSTTPLGTTVLSWSR